jgi:hypothetical protein
VDQLAAVFAAVDWRVVIARHPTGEGWQWSVLGPRRPPEDVWAALEEHAEAIAGSDAYLAWLGSDPEAGRVGVALGVIPPPEEPRC